MARQPVPVYLALSLLLLAATVGVGDWWITNDSEVVWRLRRSPVAGQILERLLGSEPRRGEITIAVDASYPPFASVDSKGDLVGFEVDLAMELGRRLADRTKLINMDAGDALFDALAANKIDAIIAGLVYLPEVSREVAYSDSYFEAGPVILARVDRVDLREPGDLRGQRVAVEIGSLGEEEARKLHRKLSGVELALMDDADHVLGAVAEGTVDAAVLDRSSIPAGSAAMARLRQVGSPLRSHPYLIAMRRKDPELLWAINWELQAMRSGGILARLERSWFGQGSGIGGQRTE